MEPELRTRRVLDASMLVLCSIGFGLCLWLLAQDLASGEATPAGCGGGPCDEVLQSRWSRLFHIPVAAFGLAAYLLFAISFVRRLRWLRTPALGAIVGGAIWFIFVQALLLENFCPWCMAAHAVALTLGLLGFFGVAGSPGRKPILNKLAVSGIAAGGLALAQIFGPDPSTHRVEAVSPADSPATLALDQLPRLGSPTAKHVIIEYFDYNCPSCRIMGRYLETLRTRHPDDIAVVCLPVPMDEKCNDHVPAGAHQPGGCELARAALAVWFARPGDFSPFHRQLLEQPLPERVEPMARAIMEAREWNAAMADPRIGAVIESNVTGWSRISTRSTVLPKLVIRNQRLVQGVPATESEFLRVMEAELGYP